MLSFRLIQQPLRERERERDYTLAETTCPYIKVLAEVHLLSKGSAHHLVLVAISEDEGDLVQQLVHIGQLQYVLVHHLGGGEGGGEGRGKGEGLISSTSSKQEVMW